MAGYLPYPTRFRATYDFIKGQGDAPLLRHPYGVITRIGMGHNYAAVNNQRLQARITGLWNTTTGALAFAGDPAPLPFRDTGANPPLFVGADKPSVGGNSLLNTNIPPAYIPPTVNLNIPPAYVPPANTYVPPDLSVYGRTYTTDGGPGVTKDVGTIPVWTPTPETVPFKDPGTLPAWTPNLEPVGTVSSWSGGYAPKKGFPWWIVAVAGGLWLVTRKGRRSGGSSASSAEESAA